nr:zf-CCHC domain-containing protein [Tanacetum cinerariifolium]
MSELDMCYSMLQELCSVIVGGTLIHMNHEGSKHEGQRIRSTIGDFGGNCASNQSPFDNERIEEWDVEKKEDDEDVKGFNCELKRDFECIYNLNVSDLDYGLILRMINKNQVKFSMEYGRRVKKYEGFKVDVKRKSIKDKVRREVLDIVEALDIENSRASSFKMRGIHVVETKVDVVRDWSSPKTLPELEYVEPLEEGAKQVTYVVQRTLCSPKVSDTSQRNKLLHTKCLVKEKVCYMIIDGGICENLEPKALVKAFNLPNKPYPSPYQIGQIKKGLVLMVTKIYKVPLAMGEPYNELVSDVVDMGTCHVLLGRP